MRTADDPVDIVVITGLSGAGRSTAAKSLEDLGWFVVDNLPPALLPTMLDLADRASLAGIAAVVDVRSRAPPAPDAGLGHDRRRHRRRARAAARCARRLRHRARHVRAECPRAGRPHA